MVRLPTGKPIFERVSARGLHPPTAINMLRSTAVTGYARFSFDSADAIFLFRSGKLLESLLEEGAEQRTGLEAINATFERLTAEDGVLNAFQLSKDLTVAVLALLHGQILFSGQTLGIVDVRGLLSKVKDQHFTGCLRIYTADRTALIFYHQGVAQGFFHDGTGELETNPDASQNIARLPDAKLDAVVTPSTDELRIVDLLAEVDVVELWDQAVARRGEEQARRAREAEATQERQRAAAIEELEAGVKNVVVSHLGAPGRQLFDKLLAEHIGQSALAGGKSLEADLGQLGQAARLLTGASQVRRLLGEIETVIDTWRSLRVPEPQEKWR